MKLYIASPHGFCAGVDRALGILNEAIKAYGVPLYVNHEIVHNKFLVDYYKKKGVIFSDNLAKIPKGSVLLLSAHGVGRSFVAAAKNHGLKLIDATCPLVTKVHIEAKNYINQGYEIVYVGKHKHQEALGVKDVEPEKIHIVASKEDITHLKIQDTEKIALLNQTTLSVDETKDLQLYAKEKFPNIELPSTDDICYATTNRQKAIKKIIPRIDGLIIIGSKNSSNSQKLMLLGKEHGIDSILIDSYTEIPDGFLENKNNIGISSGASAPESLLEEVINFLIESKGATIEKDIPTVDEKMFFPFKLQIMK